MYYHISIRWDKSFHYEKDRNEGAVRVITESYNAGKKFLFDGRWVSPIEIKAIHIFATEFPSDKYPLVSVFSLHREEVTRHWIQKPPQTAIDSRSKQHQEATSQNVFIVHGSDHEPVNELKTMLKEFGLDPVVLHEQASGGSSTLAEKLEKHAKNVGYAFVILTPDDVGCQESEVNRIFGLEGSLLSRDVILTPLDIKRYLRGLKHRARQNVIFEMGYFWGLLERERVCCLLKGNVEKPSDIEGIVYIPFKESVNEARDMIEKELREAGYEIKK